MSGLGKEVWIIVQFGIEPSRRDFASLTAVAGGTVEKMEKELDDREYDKGVYFEFWKFFSSRHVESYTQSEV